MKQNAIDNKEKYKVVFLKFGLYCISLWILMLMLIVFYRLPCKQKKNHHTIVHP